MMFQLFPIERAKSAVAACAVAVAGLALAAPAAHAGVVLFNQTGTVSATVTDSPDAGGAVVDSDTSSAEAFTRSASADDGAGNSALASHTLSLTTDPHFTLSGDVKAQSAGNRTIARSIASLTLDVTEEGFPYDIHFVTKYDSVNPDARFGSRGSIKITSLDNPSQVRDVDLSRSLLVDDGTSDTPPSPGGYDLFLGGGFQVGRYQLDLDFSADSVGGHSEVAHFSLTLDKHIFGDPGGGGDGGGGNPPPAVPLPPAALAGLATFGMMGAGKLLRRRKSV